MLSDGRWDGSCHWHLNEWLKGMVVDALVLLLLLPLLSIPLHPLLIPLIFSFSPQILTIMGLILLPVWLAIRDIEGGKITRNCWSSPVPWVTMIIFSDSGWAGLIPAFTTIISSGTGNGSWATKLDWPFIPRKMDKKTKITKLKRHEWCNFNWLFK